MLKRKNDQTVVAENIYVADSFTRRFKGLMNTKTFPSAFDALLLTPCNAVHTMFMRYNLDLLFLNHAMEVVSIIKAMKPWRISPVIRRAVSVLELPAGSIDKLQLQCGDQLIYQ